MKPISTISVCAAALLSGCHTYTPQPVDLERHIRTFEQRDLVAKRTEVDGAYGLARHDARELAKLFHPQARMLRKRAGVATAVRDNAGRWVDPQLSTDLQRILESLPHQWVASASLGFTLPINGRLDRQRNLAERERDEALARAFRGEQLVANELDRAWVRCTTARLRVELLAELIDNLQRLEQLALALVGAGGLTTPGARVFSLERRQREASHALAVLAADAAELTVKQRLGLHPDAPVALLRDFDIEPFSPTAEQRRNELLQSPRLLPLQLAHAAAEADVELQVRRQWPDLLLRPGWQEEDAQPRAGLGLSLPLPIWTGNDPEIARARAEREAAAEALRIGIEELLQIQAFAELQRDGAIAQAERLNALLALAHEQVRDSKLLAEAGQFDPLLQLDALVRVYDVRLQALAMREQAALATIDLNDLLTDPQSRTPVAPEGADR